MAPLRVKFRDQLLNGFLSDQRPSFSLLGGALSWFIWLTLIMH